MQFTYLVDKYKLRRVPAAGAAAAPPAARPAPSPGARACAAKAKKAER